MNTNTTTATARKEPATNGAGRAHYTLDALAERTGPELEQIYREGSVGADVSALVGRPRGRMLAVRHTDATPLSGLLRRFAASRAFPWDGKTFTKLSADEGGGINRVALPFGRFDWFEFRTRVASSLVDGRPCVVLDYGQPGNPWFIAKIHDEIREVSPGLWLGPAMWKDGHGDAIHVLWFAVDFNTPS